MNQPEIIETMDLLQRQFQQKDVDGATRTCSTLPSMAEIEGFGLTMKEKAKEISKIIQDPIQQSAQISLELTVMLIRFEVVFIKQLLQGIKLLEDFGNLGSATKNIAEKLARKDKQDTIIEIMDEITGDMENVSNISLPDKCLKIVSFMLDYCDYCIQISYDQRAINLCEQSLLYLRLVFGANFNHKIAAKVYYNYGFVSFQMAQYATEQHPTEQYQKAEEYFQKALDIVESAFGFDNEDERSELKSLVNRKIEEIQIQNKPAAST